MNAIYPTIASTNGIPIRAFGETLRNGIIDGKLRKKTRTNVAVMRLSLIHI